MKLAHLLNAIGWFSPPSGVRPLQFGEVNFLHTTDTHGWLGGHGNQPTYDADWGDFVAFAELLKAQAHARGQDLLVVDLGDRHDGNGLSDATVPNGNRSSPIFAQQHYDVVTVGNHELYEWANTEQEVEWVVPHFGERYVVSNVEVWVDGEWRPLAARHRYFVTPQTGTRVLALLFLFDFSRANNRTRVEPIEQAVRLAWFQQILADHPPLKVDLVLNVGHLPVAHSWTEMQQLHNVLRQAYPKTPIQYFGGHSHVRDFSVLDSALTALQSGRFCETVGFMALNTSQIGKAGNAGVSGTQMPLLIAERNLPGYARAYIDFSRALFGAHLGLGLAGFSTPDGDTAKAMVNAARRDLGLGTVLGHVRSNYYVEYVPLSHPKNIFRLLTETVLPRLGPEDQLRLVLINTGSIRYDLYRGPYTVDTHYIVLPFRNDWVRATVPKHIALGLLAKLNENDYIVQTELGATRDPKALADPGAVPPQYPIGGTRASKGYVTCDDFGCDGDDTPHRGVTNWQVPNVVECNKVHGSGDVEVYFYSFLIPNIKWAVAQLGGAEPDIQYYSDKYLGRLLDEAVQAGQI